MVAVVERRGAAAKTATRSLAAEGGVTDRHTAHNLKHSMNQAAKSECSCTEENCMRASPVGEHLASQTTICSFSCTTAAAPISVNRKVKGRLST
ncbi:hypothetical protein GUJ93_ZPchr0067g6545 [Zizania palustris]|uniref:Uncharacterized protein n=1 Tax=Zizania palustris TaxID=103762 RepID=A0A8J5QW30_ZIZPA|nr:hypothetical protein GUJ93_ZPchr0067g6545 [Zizania palustris]